ncbi:short chain dehydrogenase [Telluribacter sp. SYSU D00476]|uniref:short chain dehydrogenase n=1 Tax=Telluribacter sp. SYSU D00476 TaxID=2811430 RepID=UPI001FF4983A|nr:short chain dehydrogenase [Telluribacter sp. SYSU D00476]
MRIVVLGATGTIGGAIVQLLKEKGHEVIEASRTTQPGIDIAEPSTIDQFFDQVGEVDAIISAAGSAAFAALGQLTDDDMQLSVNNKLLGQVNMVRRGLPKLRPNGVAIITGGFLAYTPSPQTSMIAMVNAGLEGFARAAALEMTEGRRVVVVHPPWVAETAIKLGMDASPWPDATKTAEAYVTALEGTQNGVPIFVKGYEPSAS